MTKPRLFKWFKTSPEIIRLAVILYVRFPLSLRNVEDLLHERGIDICHETVRFWWNRSGPLFASEIRKRRIEGIRASHWRWHLDEVFVKISSERHYLWRAVDHEGEVLESFVTKTRDKKAALKFLRKAMRKHGRCAQYVTDKLRSFGATLLYKINASATARMRGRLVLNGTTEIRGSLDEISATHVSLATAIWLQTMVPLTAGDTVELQGYFRVADGYFAADHTSFWGCKVG